MRIAFKPGKGIPYKEYKRIFPKLCCFLNYGGYWGTFLLSIYYMGPHKREETTYYFYGLISLCKVRSLSKRVVNWVFYGALGVIDNIEVLSCQAFVLAPISLWVVIARLLFTYNLHHALSI